MSQYQQELEFAKGLAKEAGDIAMRYFRTNQLGVEWKEDNTPVTKADKKINKLVIDSVKSQFPNDGVLGEEESYKTDGSRLWVVDPIDGTQPFSIGVPTFTFSLGLVEKDPILGVIHDPVADKTYWCDSGVAYCNDARIRVNDADTINNSYIVVSSRMGDGRRHTGEVYDAVIDTGGKVFSFRSIIYGLMLVATGQVVAAMAGYCGPWDIAAAIPILEAAGAKITDLDGNTLKYDEVKNGILVSNGKVHDQMLEIIK